MLYLASGRHALFVLVLAAGLMLSSKCASVRPANQELGYPQLSVANYNIRHGRGMDGQVDLERIAQVLVELDVQVAGLQEVDHLNRRNDVEQARAIAEYIGQRWEARFFRSINLHGGEYGNAVIYDSDVLKVLDDRHVALPGREPRSAAIVLFEHASGARVQFVTTHLTNVRDEEDLRQKSVDLIEQNLFEDVPAIFGGDLNTTPETPTIADFIGFGWQIVTPMDEPTFRADAPTRTIDYMALRHGGQLELIEALTVKNDLTQLASDHLPQVTRVRLLGQ
jgi:endonuclease/exonuclease/phosphatase family metal-dependent hydrolase